MTLRVLVLLVSLIGAGNFVPVQAQKLKAFEKNAVTKATKSKKSSSKKSSKKERSGNSEGIDLPPIVFGGGSRDTGVGRAMILGINEAWLRMNPKATRVEPRLQGEKIIPLFRVDADYQYIDSTVQAIGLHLEGGYGPLGIQARQTRFREDNGDDLNATALNLLLRATYDKFFELDMGVGAFQLDGEDQSWGFHVTTPFLVHINEHFGFEYRPSWTRLNGNSVREGDIAVMLGRKHTALKLGYRTLQSPSLELDGFYMGTSLHW